MKSEKAKNYIDNNAIVMHNGDRMVDASTAYTAIDIAEHEAEERVREELTRWHDLKDELPVRWQEVILKIKACDENIYYRIGVLCNNDRFQFAGYQIGSEIIGWREIHE